MNKTLFRSIYIFFGLTMLYGACLVSNHSAKTLELDQVYATYKTEAPTKAHLKNGDVVIMPEGFSVTTKEDGIILYPDEIGIQYDLTRKISKSVLSLPKDKIVFIETYKKEIDLTVLVSSIPGITIAIGAGAVAIFGSCPTYYSFDGSSYQLEAEGFSYSIAPKLEVQDLDRLHHQKVIDGKAKIEVRNEALETHYIDQLSLVSIDHNENYQAYTAISKKVNPFSDKEILLAGNSHIPTIGKTKNGQNISEFIQTKDGQWYRSKEDEVIELTKNADHKDWIDLEFVVPKDQKEIYLLMNLRNSLINSVFFYDILLDRQNFGAIDWLEGTLDQNWKVYQFYKWYKKYFGMTIEIYENGKYQNVQSLADLGPISWSERAMHISLRSGGNIKLRLKFMPDNWQIDWLAVSLEGSIDVSVVEHTFLNSFDKKDSSSDYDLQNLERDDGSYFIQYPGNATKFEVATSVQQNNLTRSWFIRSTGYYTEWLRSEWLSPDNNESFAPPLVLSDDLIKELGKEWLNKKNDFENKFFKTMIPITNTEL